MSRLRPIAPQHISQHVFETLEEAIVECSLEPGAVLSDRRLSEELGISRTPVRDALHLLESSGLVTRRGRTGWAVALIEPRDIDELFELRVLLEPAGLTRVVEWDEQRLHALVTSFDGFSTPMGPDEIAAYLRRDDEFHQEIVSATQNRRLIQAYRVVDRLLDRCRHFTSYRYEGRVDQSLAEHRLVCEALADRDPDRAARHLRDHINTAHQKLMATVEQFTTTENSVVASEETAG
jgi:GntR family transcriptional regulator, rspAB operon transcriptional repressor